MGQRSRNIAILVGGGPAPGINSVIRSVTIEARNQGLNVFGIYEGFRRLNEGKKEFIRELSIGEVSRIHYQGGSVLKTSRAHPDPRDGSLQRALKTLKTMNIEYLITIGGDGTAYGAHILAQAAETWLRVAHIPKTIDNDIPLPDFKSTFGFHTARHHGSLIVDALMEDAKTTSRWFLVVSMGRQAGHLALGIGKSSGATLTIIGEEFSGRKIKFAELGDILEGAIIKRIAMGRNYGVAMLAEGLADCIAAADLTRLTRVKRNRYGGLAFEEIELGMLLRNELRRRFAVRGIPLRVMDKNIGYELRCMAPIPFDSEYTMDLGHTAVRYMLSGGSGAVISIHRSGRMDPLPFEDLLDESGKRIRVRHVDIQSDSYQVARSYMIRLEAADFQDRAWLKKLSQAGRMGVREFQKRFAYLIQR